MRPRTETGAGTALVVALIGLTAVMGIATLEVSVAVTTRHRAMVAADVSALAAATIASGISPGTPCDAASSAAQQNGATTLRCDLDGARVTVAVRVIGPFGSADSTAVAGPPA